MEDRIIARGLTFDDVLLVPAFSEVLPAEVDVSTRLTRRIVSGSLGQSCMSCRGRA